MENPSLSCWKVVSAEDFDSTAPPFMRFRSRRFSALRLSFSLISSTALEISSRLTGELPVLRVLMSLFCILNSSLSTVSSMARASRCSTNSCSASVMSGFVRTFRPRPCASCCSTILLMFTASETSSLSSKIDLYSVDLRSSGCSGATAAPLRRFRRIMSPGFATRSMYRPAKVLIRMVGKPECSTRIRSSGLLLSRILKR
mmetsp:Transcript_10403/g.39356  ORF Transcript_10403/g.39356 Transcript_10403/m.39356 type:complete len:201 (+) Transcript_10403:637-1239(+)